MPTAIQMTQYGPPNVLQAVEVAMPTPGPDELVLKTIAAAVNRADVEIRSGKWPVQSSSPFPYTPGLEVIGEVVAIGGEVKGFQLGDTALTMMQKLGGIHGIRPGGYQSHVLVPAETLARVPQSVDPLVMGAMGLAGVTAFQGVERLEVEAGARVLVQGATGGVGLMALQWLAARGVEAVALTRDPNKAKGLEKYGASGAVESAAPNAYDGVLEMLAGDGFGDSVRAVRPGGRVVSVGGIRGETARFTIWDLMAGRHLTGWSSEDLTPSELRRSVAAMAEQIQTGSLVVPPVETYPLPEAARAHEKLEASGHVGRLLLIPE